MDYATKTDPQVMRIAEQLVRGMDHDLKRALLTLLIIDGTLPVLGAASATANEAAQCAAVWDALIKLRPGYLPAAAKIRQP